MASSTYTQVVLVTGANQGIGFEIAKKLSTEHKDYHVILSGRRKDAVDEAVAKLSALGLDNVEGLALDVASDESIAAAAAAVDAKHGHLDVLINNAGIAATPPSAVTERQKWQYIYDVNVIGVVAVTDAFLPLLAKSKAPTKRIVNLTSGLGSLQDKLDPAAFIHKVDVPAYSSSKSALNQATLHYVVRYLDDPSWKINLTCPGFCATNLNSYSGTDDPALGAINASRLATLGIDGETGTVSNRHGPIKW